MEVEKITVKVELGAWAVHASPVLTDREGRTKEGAAGAAGAPCRELQAALQDGVDAGAPVGAGVGQGGHQGAGDRRNSNGALRNTNPGPRPIPEHFCFEHEVEFKRQENDGGVWYSHRVGAGKFCREAVPGPKRV